MTLQTDAPPFSLDLGPLHIVLDTMSEELREIRRRLPFLQDDLYRTGSVNYNNAAGAVNFISLGHPTAGHFWQVRSLRVGGQDITAAPTGTAWVVISGQPPTNTVPLVSVFDWTKQPLPQNAFYGTHELIVNQYEHLYILITAGTNGAQYTASAHVESFPELVKNRN